MASAAVSSNPAPADAAGSGNRDDSGRSPEQSLPELTAERDRLRKDLAEARDEVMRLRCQAEMLRQEWFTAKLQEEEYRKYIRKLTGEDPYISLRDVLEAEKNGLTMAQMLAEMETAATANSSGG